MNWNTVANKFSASGARSIIPLDSLGTRFNPSSSSICSRPTNPKRRTGSTFVFSSIFRPASYRTKCKDSFFPFCHMWRPLNFVFAISAFFRNIFNNSLSTKRRWLSFVGWFMSGCMRVAYQVFVCWWGFSKVVFSRTGNRAKPRFFPFVARALKFIAAFFAYKRFAVYAFSKLTCIATKLHPVVTSTKLFLAISACFYYHVLNIIHLSRLVKPYFAGSGTTGRAAKDLGRKCVLIEREEKYCEIAANRMRQEVLPLFDPQDARAASGDFAGMDARAGR
jgi:hypothetical protein